MPLRLRATPLALMVGAALLVSCAEPEIPVDPDLQTPELAEEPDVEVPDTDLELRAQLTELSETVAAAEDGLSEAIGANGATASGAAIERALSAMVSVDDEGAGAVPSLLPSQTVDRSDSASAPDQLSTTLSLAQDLGGNLARDTVELLIDVGGDLGAWQRDPAGMVELARSTAESSSDVAVLEQEILALAGEGTRALAWTFVAESATDQTLIDAAAQRGLAHLGIIRSGIDELLGTP